MFNAGLLRSKCFIFGALYPSKSGLIHKYIMKQEMYRKHIVKHVCILPVCRVTGRAAASLLGRACSAVASCMRFGTCCGSCGVNGGIFVALCSSKSGLIHKHTYRKTNMTTSVHKHTGIASCGLSRLTHCQTQPGVSRRGQEKSQHTFRSTR
jgi:hypothetical protein